MIKEIKANIEYLGNSYILKYDTDTQSYVQDAEYHAFCEDFVHYYAVHDSMHDDENAIKLGWENLDGQLRIMRESINEEIVDDKKETIK